MHHTLVTASDAQRRLQMSAPTPREELPLCGDKNFLIHPITGTITHLDSSDDEQGNTVTVRRTVGHVSMNADGIARAYTMIAAYKQGRLQ